MPAPKKSKKPSSFTLLERLLLEEQTLEDAPAQVLLAALEDDTCPPWLEAHLAREIIARIAPIVREAAKRPPEVNWN